MYTSFFFIICDKKCSFYNFLYIIVFIYLIRPFSNIFRYVSTCWSLRRFLNQFSNPFQICKDLIRVSKNGTSLAWPFRVLLLGKIFMRDCCHRSIASPWIPLHFQSMPKQLPDHAPTSRPDFSCRAWLLVRAL